MSKITGGRAGHQARRPSTREISPFDQIPRNPDGRHPVDVYVDSRVQDSVRRKWIVKLQDRILEIVGPHARLFLKLEAMVEEQSRYRERCYFDYGYTLGRSEAREKGGRGFHPHRERATSLVNQLLAQAAEDRLLRKEVTLALFRAAIGMTEEQASFEDERAP